MIPVTRDKDHFGETKSATSLRGASCIGWEHLLSSANRVCKWPESPFSLVEIIAGRNGPTGGPKIDRPSPGATTPPPLVFRRSKGRSGCVPTEHRRLPAWGDPCGRAVSISRPCHSPYSRGPPLALWARRATFARPPDQLCPCKFSLPGIQSTGLLDLLSGSKPPIDTGGGKALATNRFQICYQ